MPICSWFCPLQNEKQNGRVAHVSVGEVPVWPLSVRHHLPHDHPVAPHVTGGGELPVGDGLRSCPADWNLAALSRSGRETREETNWWESHTTTTWREQGLEKGLLNHQHIRLKFDSHFKKNNPRQKHCERSCGGFSQRRRANTPTVIYFHSAELKHGVPLPQTATTASNLY